jgi:FtsP/CotA-like multicopper oxidase with cupredoxin domain
VIVEGMPNISRTGLQEKETFRIKAGCGCPHLFWGKEVNMSKLSHFYILMAIGCTVLILPAVLPAGAEEMSPNSVDRPRTEFKTPFAFAPFTADLPIPPVVQPVAPFEAQCDMDLPEGMLLQSPKFYSVTIKEATTQIIPGVDTVIWGYDGLSPGPTFKAFHNEPVIVRFQNDLDVATIVHNHGAHVAALSDGSASVHPERLILPGESRDFCYPNIAPVVDFETFEQDITDFASTQWYHDHAHLPEVDLGITGQNVYMGLAGYYLLFDDLEQGLIDMGVLPADAYDIPLVLQDRVFAADGSLIFDPDADNFNGVLGDVFVINGKAQPKFHVERRKYRFRILNGSNARFWELRLSDPDMTFIQIGADSWLLEEAVVPVTFDGDDHRVNTVRLSGAERADVIIDFRDAPDVVFLENILLQDDGRRPSDVQIPGTPIVKFIVEGPVVENDVTVDVGTFLRPHTPIRPDEIRVTRTFEFERKGGHWAINGQFFNFERDDATPAPNAAERWILRNVGGGWAHPIHIHLEAQQLVRLSDRKIAPQERFKKDTIRLEPNTEAEVFIKFRTFTGRYVFHCHNLEHEDMAMMAVFNVGGTPHRPEELERLEEEAAAAEERRKALEEAAEPLPLREVPGLLH